MTAAVPEMVMWMLLMPLLSVTFCRVETAANIAKQATKETVAAASTTK